LAALNAAVRQADHLDTTSRSSKIERSVWPAQEVVSRVLGQYHPQVPLPKDQHPVGALGTHGAYPLLRERVRARQPRRDFITRVPLPAMTPSNTRVNSASRSRTRNRNPPARYPDRSRGCGPAGRPTLHPGWRSRPGRGRTGSPPRSRRRRTGGAGSTEKKSHSTLDLTNMNIYIARGKAT
jgi:hypothetical protein